MRVILPAVGALPVFWDINRCPLPVDCDARRVGPCIERFLSKFGHSGPISITAVGILSKVPKEILEAVSFTGIRLYDLAYGRRSIKSHIRIYFDHNHLQLIQADAKILWEKLLLEEDVMCSKTVEPANWVCGVCRNLPGRGFENFLTHLASQEHALRDQVDEQDDELEENFHLLFGNKTMVSAKATNVEHSFPENVRTMVSEEEATNAEDALSIIQIH